MPNDEGKMSRQDADRLRDVLYPDAQLLWGMPVIERPDVEQSTVSDPLIDSENVHTVTNVSMFKLITIDEWLERLHNGHSA